jgi:hypothetical protein
MGGDLARAVQPALRVPPVFWTGNDQVRLDGDVRFETVRPIDLFNSNPPALTFADETGALLR